MGHVIRLRRREKGDLGINEGGFVMECDCGGWIKNIQHLNAGFYFMATHGSKGYAGKKIVYCPWCGQKLESLDQKSKKGIRASKSLRSSSG